jgi:hypothetical protein
MSGATLIRLISGSYTAGALIAFGFWSFNLKRGPRNAT